MPPVASANSSSAVRVSEPKIVSILTAALLIGIAGHCVQAVLSKLPWMVFMQDDFFFYLKVAQNLSAGHGSTVNGLVKTNGYHPLWLLLLTGLSWFTSSPRAILGFLAASVWLAASATFWCSSHLIRLTGVRRLTAFALAAWVTIYSLRMFYLGMEVTLAIPLALAVICLVENTAFWTRGKLQSFLLGLLISAMILSRLDTIILAALILGFMLSRQEVRGLIRRPQASGLILGCLPLVVYFAINHFAFGTWMPISGMAKQLKPNFYPSLRTWEGLYLWVPSFLAIFLPLPIAILLFPLAAKRFTAIQKAVYPAVLAFPLVYLFILSCLSDWSLWGWYMYVFRPSMCISVIVLVTWQPLARLLKNTFVTGLLCLCMFVALVKTPWRLQHQFVYDAAVQIVDFAKTHPGTYAMGDRAGRVIYMLKDPVVQTEGLVMDRTFLDLVRKQTPLRTVLDRYGVRYYIATFYTPYSGCFEAVEPVQAGPASPKMRGEFCEQPVKRIVTPEGENLIFDVKPEHE